MEDNYSLYTFLHTVLIYSDPEKKHHVFVSEGVNNALPPMRVGCSRVFGMITIEGD